MADFSIREAEISDVDLIFEWANDAITRKNSINQEKIEYKDHLKWFEMVIQSSTEKLYIFLVDGEPTGQIRFTTNVNEAIISYSLDAKKRGNGYGKIILQEGIKYFKNKHPEINAFIAKVKSENISSIKCFDAVGFKEIYKEFHYYIPVT